MRYVPHEYQEYAKEFIISHKVSALFLDCGLGKTVIEYSNASEPPFYRLRAI